MAKPPDQLGVASKVAEESAADDEGAAADDLRRMLKKRTVDKVFSPAALEAMRLEELVRMDVVRLLTGSGCRFTREREDVWFASCPSEDGFLFSITLRIERVVEKGRDKIWIDRLVIHKGAWIP